MGVFDNPSQEFERVINGAQEQGTDIQHAGEHTQQAAKDAAKTLPQGTPRTDYTVRSIYDSRPVNAFDVNPIATAEPAAPGNTIFNIFRVPQNYICVPRKWYHFFSPPPALNRDEVEFTLQVDGADVQFNTDIPVGIESNALIESFFVVDEFSQISVDVRLDVALPVGTDLFIQMYANLIQKTGVPAQFDIANLAGIQKPPPLTPSTRVETSTPPLTPQMARPPTPKKPAQPMQCPPGHKLLRVQLADGSFEMRCVPVLGQSRGR